MTPRALHAGVLVLSLAPLGALGWRAAAGDLGANPVEAVTHETGEWALRLLLASLAVTPLRRLTGLRALAPLRRTLGLVAFLYATLHAGTWGVLDLGLDPILLADDVLERPYVMAGLAAYLSLVPLAVTSTRGWQRRLGRRWIVLHRLSFVAAAFAVVHFLWLVKKDLREPLIYAGILAVLLLVRLAFVLRRTPSRPEGGIRETPHAVSRPLV